MDSERHHKAVLTTLRHEEESVLASSTDLQKLRHIYVALYTVGGCCSLITVALLVWIAFCIAVEKEPLAAIAFLPAMPSFFIFIILIAILVISITAWQTGAKYHQQYDLLQKKQRQEGGLYEKN
jgi:hypothetical protein